MTLTPAYNRDYKNKNDVLTDFNNDKDFIINDMFSPYNGKYCNKSDIKNGITKMNNFVMDINNNSVKIRYNKLQKICIVKL